MNKQENKATDKETSSSISTFCSISILDLLIHKNMLRFWTKTLALDINITQKNVTESSP